jgi:hypothetical protein
MTVAPSLDPDPPWQKRLHPLPIRVAPLPGELMACYLRRLANANRILTDLLLAHLGQHQQQPGTTIRSTGTYDIVLNPTALDRLTMLSGCTKKALLNAIPARAAARTEDGRPSYWRKRLAVIDPALARPCSYCCARRGVRIPTIIRLQPNQLPLCLQHSRSLILFRTAQTAEHSLEPAPEITAAARRWRNQNRRHPATAADALAAATTITESWKGWSGQYRFKPCQIIVRWRARAQGLPGVPDNVVRYPETIALATMFAQDPTLLLTPGETPNAPSPMQLLLRAARCLDHPAPEQVLRLAHPLFRWANTPLESDWWWRNTIEPDRTIYMTLHRGLLHLPARSRIITS